MSSLALLLTLGSTGLAQDRIIGLVEIPALYATSSADGSASAEPIRLFAESRAPPGVAALISDGKQIETREHGYEELSAAVYAVVGRGLGGIWYKVRYGEDRRFGWLFYEDAGEYRDAHTLILEGMAFLTDDWDGRLFSDPRRDATEVPFDHPPGQVGVRVIDVYQPSRNEPWYLLAVVDGTCTGEPLEVLATGWVPAYADTGANNVWFYSRGC